MDQYPTETSPGFLNKISKLNDKYPGYLLGHGLGDEEHEPGEDFHPDGQVREGVRRLGRSDVRHGGRDESDDRHQHSDGLGRHLDEAGSRRGRNRTQSRVAQRGFKHNRHSPAGIQVVLKNCLSRSVQVNYTELFLF